MYVTLSFSHNMSGGFTPQATADTAASYAARLGISATAIPTTSSVKGRVEHGARIELFDVTTIDIVDLWDAIRCTFALRCCWIREGFFQGCIQDWLDCGPVKPEPVEGLWSEPFPTDPNAPDGPGRSDYVAPSLKLSPGA